MNRKLKKIIIYTSFILTIVIINKNILLEFIKDNTRKEYKILEHSFLEKNILIKDSNSTFSIGHYSGYSYAFTYTSMKLNEKELLFSNDNVIEDKHDFEYFLLSIVAKPYFEEKLSNMKKMREILDGISKKYKVDLKLDYAYKYGDELFYMNFKVNKKEDRYFLTNINENMAAKIIKESIQKKTQIEDIDAKKIFDNISEPVVIVTANKDIINEIHKKLNDNKIKVIFSQYKPL